MLVAELLWTDYCDQDFCFEHFDAFNRARLAEISEIERKARFVRRKIQCTHIDCMMISGFFKHTDSATY